MRDLVVLEHCSRKDAKNINSNLAVPLISYETFASQLPGSLFSYM